MRDASATLAARPEPMAGPPDRPRCLPLAAGTTGVMGVGGQPVPSQVLGSGGLGAPSSRRLPATVWFKDGRHAVSNTWAFALRSGHLFARAAERGHATERSVWRRVDLPACLDGRVTSISADHRLLLAMTEDRQVYSHDMPGNDLSAERWTWRWGPYLWTGSGVRLPDDVTSLAASELNGEETFTDSSGRTRHPIGVATLYLLREGGRRLTYLDPWLPVDQSREVCLPDAGRTRLASLDASGSTILAASRDGRLFTRLYDFDTSGANSVFGEYSWQRGRPATDVRWQLPGPDWRPQPAPPGPWTDLVSIVKTGRDASQRELRVAGRRTTRPGAPVGVWTKPLLGRHWRFVATGGVLRGRALPLTTRPLSPRTRRFEGRIGERRVVVPAFDWACSPTTLRVEVAPGAWLRLQMHAFDALRQVARARGLDDEPRDYNAAIEVPSGSRLAHRPAARAWVREHLDGRFTVTPLAVTATRLRFVEQCWQLTLEGRSARPDRPTLPPDLGIVLGRLVGLTRGESPPSPC